MWYRTLDFIFLSVLVLGDPELSTMVRLPVILSSVVDDNGQAEAAPCPALADSTLNPGCLAWEVLERCWCWGSTLHHVSPHLWKEPGQTQIHTDATELLQRLSLGTQGCDSGVRCFSLGSKLRAWPCPHRTPLSSPVHPCLNPQLLSFGPVPAPGPAYR